MTPSSEGDVAASTDSAADGGAADATDNEDCLLRKVIIARDIENPMPAAKVQHRPLLVPWALW